VVVTGFRRPKHDAKSPTRGPAEASALVRKGDCITHFNGATVTSADHLFRLIKESINRKESAVQITLRAPVGMPPPPKKKLVAVSVGEGRSGQSLVVEAFGEQVRVRVPQDADSRCCFYVGFGPDPSKALGVSKVEVPTYHGKTSQKDASSRFTSSVVRTPSPSVLVRTPSEMTAACV